jgi:two-component system sensor histidine kinase KdpD
MNEPSRPNPDALLADIQREERAAKRGQLKVFFGMCPGVGKTYAMLEAARARKRDGWDVVVGVVETHGRAETQALLQGQEVLSRKAIEYRGVALQEMDIDGLLARRPKLAIVDELAHTNAPGSRHPKRYQDVLELIEAGIDVYSTLNVQHVESRSDLVQAITGFTVRETVPDSVLDQADEVELVDLTTERLRKRLADGKVYLGDRAATAAENFFREENLTALREMALRATAERVDQELRAKRSKWQSGQRLAVGVGPSPFSGTLIRWTRRIAAAMDAPWLAIYVETPRELTEEEKTRLTKNLSLARQLGAEVVMTAGADVAAAMLEAAREHHATQIVVGRGGWMTNRLIRQAGNIDVHIVAAQKTEPKRRRPVGETLGADLVRDCAVGTGVVAAVTVVGWLLHFVTGSGAIALVYLLAVVLLAAKLNRWATLWVAMLSALSWNFLFTQPMFTLQINSAQDAMMFGLMFVVAIVMGHLTNQLHTRETAERRRQQRTAALNRLLASVAASTSLGDGLERAVAEVDALFGARTVVLLDGKSHPASTFQPDEKERGVAAWSLDKGVPAGRFTDTLPDAAALYLPLRDLGVLGVSFTGHTTLTLDERELLETFAGQIAALIERYRLIEAAQAARITGESEKLHRTLLDSVSHELKTPLAVIGAATEGLDTQLKETDVPLGKTFLDEIKAANRRLRRIVDNLLDMTRIESGRLPLKLEWGDVRELMESAVEQVANEISRGRIHVDAPAQLPPVRLDFGLMEQALCNLLLNAVAHSPTDAPIRLSAEFDGGALLLRVSDQGTGLVPGEERKVFEKFYRGQGARPGGTGLGLSIVQGIARAHRAEVTAENNPSGGATFTIRVPA